MEKRICKKCQQEFPLSSFRKYFRKGKDYWGYECHACGRAHAIEYHRLNKDKNNKRHKERYWSDPERHRERGRIWYYDNRERAIASSIEWRKNNREKDRESSKKWRMSHLDHSRLLSKKRRAKVKNAKVETITKDDIKAIREAQNGKCAICRKITHKGHIDHIVPLSKGGEHSKRNLQITCAECNLSKSSKDPIDFMRSLGRLI